MILRRIYGFALRKVSKYVMLISQIRRRGESLCRKTVLYDQKEVISCETVHFPPQLYEGCWSCHCTDRSLVCRARGVG